MIVVNDGVAILVIDDGVHLVTTRIIEIIVNGDYNDTLPPKKSRKPSLRHTGKGLS